MKDIKNSWEKAQYLFSISEDILKEDMYFTKEYITYDFEALLKKKMYNNEDDVQSEICNDDDDDDDGDDDDYDGEKESMIMSQ